MDPNDDDIDLLQLTRTIWRRRWRIALSAVLAVLLGFFYATMVAQPVYVATATVSIESNEPQVAGLDSLVGGLSAEQPSLNTEIYLIRSRQLLRRLVVQENLLEDPEFNPLLAEVRPFSVGAIKELVVGPEAPMDLSQEMLIRIAIDRLRNRLSVSNPSQSFVFEIGISAATPEKATDLANALALTYINDQLLFKEAQSQTAMEFLNARTQELQIELNEAELAVKDFAIGIELVSPEALAAKNRQVKALRDRVNALQVLIGTGQQAVGQFQAVNLESLDAAEIDQLGSAILSRLVRDVDESPEARGRFVLAFEQAWDRAQSELEQNILQRTSLIAAVDDLEAEVDSESRDLLTLQQLQREADAIGEIYSYFLTRLKEAEVQQGTQQADARLLSPAVIPLDASSPRTLFLVSVMGVLGAMLGVALVLLSELRNSAIRTAEDLQNLTGLPILGQIPLAPVKKRAGLIPFLRAKANSPFAEAIRNLRTSLMISSSGDEPCIILITSSVPGEGKTTTSISLAQSLAGMDKSVLLVDGDVRKKSFNQYFDEPTAPDLSDLLSGTKSLLAQKCTVEGLGFDLVLGNKPQLNAADFLSSSKFKEFLDTARAAYDHVIIDAPPILPVTDARIIGRHVDAILYAVGWDDTRAEVVKAGLSEFVNANLSPTGLILTKIDGKRARSYGGATRYGSYYGEYSKGYYS